MQAKSTAAQVIALLAIAGAAGCASTNVASMKDADAPIEIVKDEKTLWERGADIERRIDFAEAVYQDPELTSYLQGVVNELISRISSVPPPGPRVILLDTSIRNAFALPHGALYFSTGLLASLESEAEFAVIAAHELTHYLNRHSLSATRDAANREKWSVFSTALLAGIGAALAGEAGANAFGSMSAQSMLTWQLAAISGYSQELEWQADNEGLEMVLDAGFDASIAPMIFDRLKVDADDDDNKSYYSSHPRLSERQEHYKQVVAEHDFSNTPKGLGSPDFRGKVEMLALGVARHSIDKRDYDEAGQTINRFLSKHPANGEALFLKAEVSRLQGTDGSELVPLYTAASEVPDANPDAWKELGLAFRASGQTREATKAFTRFLEARPDSIEAPLIRKYIEETGNQTP